MAAPIGSAPPARFTAGETVKYNRSFADFPVSAGWAMALHVAGASSFSVSGTPSGTIFAVTIPAAKTATVNIANGVTTAASKVVTRASGDFVADGVLPGYLVNGKNIPSGAYVKTVDSATQVTLSEAAEAGGSSLVLAFRFPAGTYSWAERVTLAGEVYLAASGTMAINPDLVGAPAGALQSWASRMLPLVEDVIEGRIPMDAAAYQIGDRAKTLVDLEDWLAFRRELQAEAAAEASPGKVKVMLAAFTGAGFDR